MIAAPGFTQRQNARLHFWMTCVWTERDTLAYDPPDDDTDVLWAQAIAHMCVTPLPPDALMVAEIWRTKIAQPPGTV